MKKIAIFLILLISITIFAFKEKEIEVEASGTWVEIAYISGYYFIGSSYNDILTAYNEGNEIYVRYMSQEGRLLYNSANNYFYLESTTGSTIGVGGPNSSIFADCIIGYYYSPKYTVTFKDWNNTTLKSEVVTEGGNATPPTNPTRTGYTFASWSGTYTNVTSNQTVTAQYNINSYTVTFVDWNGATLKTQSVNYGSNATPPTNPSRTGYTFTSWSGIYTNITSSRTITATYSNNTYTVEFKDYDGTILKSQSTNYGGSVTPPADPIRDGFSFNGWDNSSYTYVEGNLTITAQYIQTSFTVTFKDWNGTTLKSQTTSYGGSVTPPTNPTRLGYTFTGWNDNSYTYVESDLTITAQYTQDSYTVTFKDYDGTTLKTTSTTYGGSVTPPVDPSRVGYTFTGWSGTYTNVTSTRTITATYSINTFTVEFKDYDGTTLKSQTVNYNTSATPPTNPSRTGYTFTGWSGTYTNVTSNQTVTAQYNQISYTVTFKDFDGTTLKEQSTTYGGSVTPPADPTRLGYLFSGWDDSSYTYVESDLTIIAEYSQITYTVTFEDYNGTTLKEQSTNYGGSVTPPADPIRTGYTFTGWDNSSYTYVESDLTITATYSINTYTVTFVDWNDVVLSTQTINYGSNATLPTTPTRVGYTFVSWSGTYTNVTSSRTITATYSINTFTVEFKDWNDVVLSTQTINYGSNATPPVNPSRTGYTFTGWIGTYTNVTSNQIVTAQYNQISYTVTFKDFDGTTLKEQSTNYGGSVTPPSDPTRVGYLFSGWDTDYSYVESDLTVIAQYTQITYTVTFKDFDGTTLKEQSTNYGGSVTPPVDPSRVGYTFTGWDTDYSYVESDLTITAQYAQITYTVTFKDFDGTTLKEQSTNYGGNVTPPVDPIRTGFTFTGWDDSSYTYVESDLTIIAQYAQITYTVTFKDFDGTTLKEQSTNYGGSVTPPLDPSRVGYTFTGWDTDYSYVESDLTVTAQYTQITYTVTFKDFDGTILKEQSTNYGGNVTPPADPIRPGYAFTSWDNSSYTYVESDLVITAQYTQNTYTVIFEDYDGSILKTDTVPHGYDSIPPSDPIRPGYTFISWSGIYTNVTSNLTITAQYTQSSFTVTYQDFDGSILKIDTVAQGDDSIPPTTPTRIGYTFSSWSGTYTNVTSNQTVTATYTITEYTITFMNYDSSVYTTQVVTYGALTNEPLEPIREGFSFVGWFKDELLTVLFEFDLEMVYSNQNLYSKWTPISSYLVEFRDYNNDLIKSEFVLVGESANPPTNLSRVGYSFVGWDKDYTSVNQNLVIKAIYTLNTSSSDGDILSSNSMMIVFIMGGLVGLSILISIFKRKKRGYRR